MWGTLSPSASACARYVCPMQLPGCNSQGASPRVHLPRAACAFLPLPRRNYSSRGESRKIPPSLPRARRQPPGSTGARPTWPRVDTAGHPGGQSHAIGELAPNRQGASFGNATREFGNCRAILGQLSRFGPGASAPTKARLVARPPACDDPCLAPHPLLSQGSAEASGKDLSCPDGSPLCF